MFRQIFKKLLNKSLLLILTCDNSSKRMSLKVSLEKCLYFFVTYNFGLQFTESSFHYSDHHLTCHNFARVLKVFRPISKNQINTRRLSRIFQTSALVDRDSKRIQIAKTLQSCMFHACIRNILVSCKIWTRHIRKMSEFQLKSSSSGIKFLGY